MHHTQALKTLLQCLEDLTGTVETFGQDQKLHEVEKDLVLYRGRLLYEAILKLPTDVATAPEDVVNEFQAAPVAMEAPTVQADLSQEEEISEEAIEVEVEKEGEAEIKVSMESEATSKTISEPEITIDRLTITLEKPESATADQQTAAPRIKAVGLERFSIAEVLHQSGDKDLILTHLKLKPIQDLKSGIGLNEKFLFIRELFENDHQAYAQAVDALNSRENIEDAEAYIAKELLPRYGWELEKEALLNFLHLVLRRFSNV